MIGEIVFQRLSTFPGTVALVDDRIYPLALPQEPILPAITYQEQSDESGEGAGQIIRKRLRIFCWALTYGEAKAVGQAVLQGLRGYKRDDTVPQLAGMDDDNRSDVYVPERGFFGDMLEMSAWVVEI